ncbi:MAG: signal peptidase II [Proteobacteria bacterium]|nr:signal peptidase II [Pseudomonadota bacterium]
MKKLNVTREGWIAYGLGLLVLILDQWSKSAALGAFMRACPGLQPHPGGETCHIPFLKLVSLTMVWNPGMSFGLGRDHADVSRWVFAIFAIGVAGAIGWWAHKNDKRLFTLAAGFLMGGALGNVIDRFRYGAVVDFIDVTGIFGALFRWVFNVADSAITVGAALLLLEAALPSLRQALDSRAEKGS